MPLPVCATQVTTALLPDLTDGASAPTYPVSLPEADLEAQVRAASENLAAAEYEHDRLQAELMRNTLRRAFPGATMAIFARNWDEDHPRLLQLLGGEEDIDLPDGAVLTDEQADAVERADDAIFAMNSDERALNHLDYGEEEHDSWYEYQLDLT